MSIVLGGRALRLGELREIAAGGVNLQLDSAAAARIAASSAVVQRIAGGDAAVYGVNTSIGKLATTRIPRDQLAHLQRNIILSHATGTGPLLDDGVVRLVLALKISSFARGYSGVRPGLVDALLACYHRGLLPCIPAKGSVGASGDLAPLAHMAAVLLGEGEAVFGGRRNASTSSSARATSAASLSWFQYTPSAEAFFSSRRFALIAGIAPPAKPTINSRPLRASALTLSSVISPPTGSNTTSTPRPPVQANSGSSHGPAR